MPAFRILTKADATAHLAARSAEPDEVTAAMIDEIQAGRAQLGLDESGVSWIRATPQKSRRRFSPRRGRE